ncbi:Uma2 family endonuclease [Picosynechococcus sp. PCC 7117]|uniref:Uma2 family endonuclease n=1 Tax=Picosynechococcus sp. PCC 7117 TaxID=195498 RepID=UPI00081069A6|nr:Uma2 family endonuclease [Picosynechococcus sp. PCC 7117]ANV85997.1 hypothetical protein AWQ22_00055 [Picosynechococcus sp. PCC 7117]
MVIAEEKFPRFTPDEYLRWEEQQVEKYEYIDGQIYAMGGGNKNHSLIAVRLSSLFFNHLDGSGCETGNSDLKIKIPNSHNYTYPDISVTCDERDQSTTQFITYPCLVVEVLSKSTEAYDRGGKFRLYRQNPVLKDYLLVSSTAIEMDLYHKNKSGEWLITNYQAGDMVTLESIGLTFSIEQAYQGLRFL